MNLSLDQIMVIFDMYNERESFERAIRAKVGELRREEEIRSEISKLTKMISEEEDRYRSAIIDLQSKIRECREKCNHNSREYIPDPSGNNDSCLRCNICGHEEW